MPAAPYSFLPAPFVIALQWTGSNVASFVAAGFTSGDVAVAEDGVTLILGASIPGFAQPQYVPVPVGSWIVSAPLYTTVPDPLPPLGGLVVSIVDPNTFTATYTWVNP